MAAKSARGDLRRKTKRVSQFLVRVKRDSTPGTLTDRFKAAGVLRAKVIEALKEEQHIDKRVRFTPLAGPSLISVIAPPSVIERLAQRSDVESVKLDEPADALGDFRIERLEPASRGSTSTD